MKTKFIYKVGIILFTAILLLHQAVCANCTKGPILPFVSNKNLVLDKRILDDDTEVCIYTKEQGNRGEDYMYVLLRDNVVVYCGITNDPERRAKEHKVEKAFDKMVAIGRLYEDKARDMEKACVCEYDNPVYNQRPYCDAPIDYIGGGGTCCGIE